MEHGGACYREYLPCAGLRDLVRAYFSFLLVKESGEGSGLAAPRAVVREDVFGLRDSFCSPLFADSHASIVFSFSQVCRAGGVWQANGAGPRGDVIGPMTTVGSNSPDERPEMLGVFLRASAITRLFGVSARELTDRIVPLEALWGPSASAVASNLAEIRGEWARLQYLDSVLLGRTAGSHFSRGNVDTIGLADWVWRHAGRMKALQMAEVAGTSRQHLTRLFREVVGVTPKLYGRLARFHSTLRYMRPEDRTSWAEVALEAGYADQSHMIREFRHFSNLTPEALRSGAWFHPFIERKKMPVPFT
jgi:AraC-like DNA-binding protein